jgi:hypothetical protein
MMNKHIAIQNELIKLFILKSVTGMEFSKPCSQRGVVAVWVGNGAVSAHESTKAD